MDFAGMKRRELQALCKRHGLPAGGTNAALAARLAEATVVPGVTAGAGDVALATRKGCLKRTAGGNGLGGVKNVSFMLEQSRGWRRRSQVSSSPAVVSKTRGKSKAAAETGPDNCPTVEAGGRGRGRRRRAEAGGVSAEEDSVAAEAGAGAPVRRSRRNSVTLRDFEAVEDEHSVAVDRKRKWKSQEKEEETAVSAQVEVPCRVARRSSLSAAALLPPPAAEKKRGSRKAAVGKNEHGVDDQVAEAQGSTVAGSSAAVECKRSRRKGDDEAVVQNAKVEAPCIITRSRAAVVTVTEPVVVEKRRRTTEYEQPEVELPAILEVPRNDAPVTMALRNRVPQVKNINVEGTHVAQELDNKRLPTKQDAHRNQLLASSMEEESQGQVVAPSKRPPTRRSGRKNSEAKIADSETNKSSSVPMKSSDAKGKDVEKQIVAKDPVRRLTRKSIVSAMFEKDGNDPVAEKGPEPEIHATRSKRKSVVPVKNIPDVSEEFQNAKGDNVEKQLAVKEPARRSTRKSIASAMLKEDDKDVAEGPEPKARVTRSKRKSVVPVKNFQDVYEYFQNANVDDVMKQPAVKEPSRRSTRKFIVSTTLEEEDKTLIAEKSPEAHVRRLKRKSVAPVKDCKGDCEATQNAKDKDVVKQPTVTEPVRRSTRKCIVSAMVDEEGKNLIAEKSPEPHVRTLKRKSVVPVQDNKGDGDETQKAKDEDVTKQLAVKKPVRRSTRKSVASGILEKDQTDLIAANKPKAHDKRSVRKSVLPNYMNNKENQDNIKMARNEDKGGDEEKQLNVKGPVTLSRQSVATMVSEKKGFHKETKSQIPMTRSTCKSVPPNVVEKEDMAHSKMVGRELSGAGSQNLKARAQVTGHGGTMAISEIELQVEVSVQNSIYLSTLKSSNHKLSDDNTHSGMNKYITCEKASEEVLKLGKHGRSSVEISSSFNDSCNAVDNTQTSNKIDSKGTNCEITTSKGRPTKIRAIVSEVEEAKCEDRMVMEAVYDAATHSNNSTGRMEEICQYNATGEEFSSGPSLVTSHEERIVQTTHNVLSGSESADAQNPEICPSSERCSSDHNKQTQEDCTIQTCDDILSEPRIEELGQLSSIAEVLQHNGNISEDKTLRNEGEVKSGNKNIKIVNGSSDEVGLETSNKLFQRSTADVLIVDAGAPMLESTTVNVEIKQSDAEATPTVLSCYDGIAETVTELQFTGQKDGQGVSTDAYESVPPISDTSKQESHSDEQSIRDVDMGKCLSKTIKGTPLSPNPHSHGADADSILPALDGAEGSSSERSHSSFGLDLLFAEECKESSSRNETNTVVEVDYGTKHSACVSPGFCMRSDCGVECENVQTLGCDTDKTLDVGHVAQEEFVAVEKSNDEYVAAEYDLKTMELNCILAENSSRLVAESCDNEHAVIQVQQDAVHEGTLEKRSLCSAAAECKHECRLPEVAGVHSISNMRCSQRVEQSPLGLQSLFSQQSLDDSMEHGALASAILHTECGVDQLKDCHVQCTVETTTVSQPISHCNNHLVTEIVYCKHVSQPNNGIEGLPEVSHEKLVSSSLPSFSVDANHRKEMVNSAELICKGDGNKNIFHAEDLNASSEKSHANMSAYSNSGISGTVLSGSLHAPDTDNDDVRLGSNLAQLDSIDLLVELIEGSNTEIQHSSKKKHDLEDSEYRVASGPCTNDVMEAATAKCIESGVMLLPAEGRENLKDGQLNSKLNSSQVLGSAFNCNKDIRNTIDNGSVAGTIGERNSLGFILPKDYPEDDYLRHEPLDNFSVENSLEKSSISMGKNVSTAGTVSNPSFDSAMSEHKCVLFEEVEHRMKNYVGNCSSNPKELLMELQSMSSKENMEESDQDSPALPISGFRGDDSTIVEQHVKVQQGSNLSQLDSNDFVDDSTQCFNMEVLHQGHNNLCNGDSSEEQVAFKPCTYDTTEAATVKYIESEVDLLPVEEGSELQDGQLNSVLESAKVVESSFSCNKDVRDIFENGSVSVVYEKFLFGDKSDSRVNKMNDFVGTCLSNPRELLMELQSSSDETTEDLDPHDKDLDPRDDLAFPSTEREADKSTICDVENLAGTVVSSEPGVCLGPSQDFSRDKGKQDCMSGSVKNSMFKLPEDCHLACQNQDVPDVLSVSQCPKESTDHYDETVLGPGTLKLPDEQNNTKLEGPEIEEDNCVNDKDTTGLFDADLVGKSKASNLPPDIQLDASSEYSLPNVAQWNAFSDHNFSTDLSYPISPEKFMTLQNDVSGSIGICPSSRRRAIDEISTKLQKFKVSSAVKGSFNGMSALHPKQGENLNRSAATAWFRNIENMHAVKSDHLAKPNPDRSAAKDSSRRALQPLSGRPRDQ